MNEYQQALVRIIELEDKNAELRRGIERLEFLSHMRSGIPTTADDRLDLIGEEASALLTAKEK